MATRIYVAGAWVEQDTRARPMMAAVRGAGRGFSITHDWTTPREEREARKAQGITADAHLSQQERRQHALEDLRGVEEADVFWLLAPEGKEGCGSWVELGYALALARQTYSRFVIVSGGNFKRTIFTEMARVFATDEEAFRFIVSNFVVSKL
jgi:hypothetical protein